MKDLNDRFVRLASLWLANIHLKKYKCESFLYHSNDSEILMFSAFEI